MSSFGSRLEKAFSSQGHLCLGIDPSREQLNAWSLPDSAEGAKRFGFALLEAADGLVGIVKPQVSFFEQYGPAGLTVLIEILTEARARGLLTIADAKRGDIGSTMVGYSRAWLSKEAVFVCDALTLSPYLGPESLEQTVLTALENSRGIFLLAATSNPEAHSLQSSRSGTQSVAQSVVSFASSHCEGSLGSIGVVIGANVSLPEVGIDFENSSNLPVLVPGFGHQGADLSSLSTLFGPVASNAVCSISRSIAGSSPEGLVERISAAKAQLLKGLGV